MLNAGERKANGLAEEAQAYLAHSLEAHALEVRRTLGELDRLSGLIHDAGARLIGSFGAIHELSRRQQAIVGEPEALRAAARDFESAVSEAVQALQFQDMANQLVEHAAQRVARLERIAGELCRLPDVSADDVAKAAERARAAGGASPVEQGRVSGGAVELF